MPVPEVLSTYCLVANWSAEDGSCVTVTLVIPAKANVVAPRAILVVPMVSELLVRALLGMFVSVLLEPLMVLLVSVSVVARPTKVSVDVGSVKVPVLTIEEMVGETSVRPLTLVVVPPKEIVVDPRTIELVVSEPGFMFVSVLVDPLIDTPVSVVRVPPKETDVDPIVTALLTRLAFATLVRVLSEALKVTPVIVPPVTLMLLEFWTAIEPKPRFVLAPDAVLDPVPPLTKFNTPPSVRTPLVVIGPPEKVSPVVPPEASTLDTRAAVPASEASRNTLPPLFLAYSFLSTRFSASSPFARSPGEGWALAVVEWYSWIGV